VDSAHESSDAAEAAVAVFDRYRCVVVSSGATDLVISGRTIIRVSNGHPMMPKITGLGCTATALIGAFAAVNPSAVDASVHAMAVTGIAGELAARKAQGPGTFLNYFLDALYLITESDVHERLKVQE
jgi:hydroxyethylthiazole kinase